MNFAPDVTNLNEFKKSLNEYREEVKSEFGKEVFDVLFEAMHAFTDRTPVDTGRARAGWRGSVDAPTNEGGGPERPGLLRDRQGGATIANAMHVFSMALRDNVFRNFYIQNNVPYIEILEGGRRVVDGRVMGSLQSPYPGGIFDITVIELKEKFEL